tara:strand:+ start:1658 stop:1930 length:273 start_codon:yes stop_codon:yes gene_type:complete
MNNTFYILIFNFLSIIAIIFLLYPNTKKEINSFGAYYNSEGAFAGFIQKKENLFRACEFSSNGSILSCSKWFDDDLLQQGQNEGINQKNI